MLKKSILLMILVGLTTTSIFGQLQVDAEIRPRFEYRHGFKTLFPDHTDPAAFISQRTRLNVAYGMDNFQFYLSTQDVRVWGDVPQLNKADNNGLSLHEAWAKIGLNKQWALKLGRQEILYDDSRIFGNVGWAQQARSHDAALLQFRNAEVALDIGLAFNQDGENLTGTTLNTKTYKAFQYARLYKHWSSFSSSFLFLNNGLQYIDEVDATNNDTRYSHTVGTHLKYDGQLSMSTNLFYQFGKDVANQKLNAFLLSIDAKYQVSEKFNLSFGTQYLSGNDSLNPTGNENKAFNPYYGTNHKFNGFMDYFYVGNHLNSIGLCDIYMSANVTLNKTSNLLVACHNFSAAGDVSKPQLGNEIDFVYTKKIQEYVVLKAGYSHLFEANGMETLKNNFDNNMNNWGWVMIVIKPTLFKHSKN